MSSTMSGKQTQEPVFLWYFIQNTSLFFFFAAPLPRKWYLCQAVWLIGALQDLENGTPLVLVSACLWFVYHLKYASRNCECQPVQVRWAPLHYDCIFTRLCGAAYQTQRRPWTRIWRAGARDCPTPAVVHPSVSSWSLRQSIAGFMTALDVSWLYKARWKWHSMAAASERERASDGGLGGWGAHGERK